MLRRPLLRLAVAATLAAPGCLEQLPECPGTRPGPGAKIACSMPGYTDRAFDLELPASWDGAAPLPLIVAFHGGGGRRESAETVSCPGGDASHAACLGNAARARGFAVVRPDGQGTRPARNLRTWNAGGGRDGWNCASGPACRAGVDDVAYVRALVREVGATVPIDPRRVFATGLSNGAAMSHRVACELPELFAAIAAVGGTNQLSTLAPCRAAVPVLQIHGTRDPCWTYATSSSSCLEGGDAGKKLGVAESMEGWRARNGCGAAATEAVLPDVSPGDGTTTTRVVWSGCAAATELLRVDGGGHAWPGGDQYFSADRIGPVPRDFGSEVVVDFFVAHGKK